MYLHAVRVIVPLIADLAAWEKYARFRDNLAYIAMRLETCMSDAINFDTVVLYTIS